MVLKVATEVEGGGLTEHFRDWNPDSECGAHDVVARDNRMRSSGVPC